MKQYLFYLVLACLMMFSGSGMAKTAQTKQTKTANEGPVIKESDNEIFKTAEDEHGLKRVGNMNNFHFFGYGELHYNGRRGPAENEVDFHRLVLGFGYDFTDWARFRAELDFEHAFTEPELEYAYVEFDIKEWFNIRAGDVLIPMGVINKHHEPPLFYSVERPELYRVIIPTTWQEAGLGFYGNFAKGFDYELYVVSTPTAVTVDGGAIDRSFNGSNGIRNGRNHVAEAKGRDFGVTGRLQYTGVPGLRLGTSAFIGNTGHGTDAVGGALLTMLEADAKYSIEGIELEGALAFTNLSKARELNTYLVSVDPAFSNFAARQMLGWYIEGAYHLFHHIMPNTKHDLVAFARYEDFNTQFKMPTGFASNPANDRNTMTVGLSYMPLPQVAIKTDYMFNWNAANAGVDQFNMGIGFYY